MRFLLPTVVLLALASGVAAQCTGNDHPSCGFCNLDGTQTAAGGGSTLNDCVDANANCASWVTSKNFCARSDYANSMKLLYCCKTCRPIIFAPPTTVTPTTGAAAASTPAPTPTPTPAPSAGPG